MKFLIAPNALKGSLSAIRAAEIIAEALHAVDPGCTTDIAPIADGGDGTLDCLVAATGGKTISTIVHGPVEAMSVEARWGVLGDGSTTAIEMAETAGLRLLTADRYDVANATTFGVGQLMFAACTAGYKKIVVGLGGSATNDGGAGCAAALGVRFLDSDGNDLPPGGGSLARLHAIETKNFEPRMREVQVIGLTDVTNVLCGPEGATRTFAPQKGGTPDLIPLLDRALEKYASIIKRDLGMDVTSVPGGGAAG